MKKILSLILLVFAAVSAQAYDMSHPSFYSHYEVSYGYIPDVMYEFKIQEDLYCPYLTKEYFNPEPFAVTSNGLKVLMAISPQWEYPTRYVVLEDSKGRRYMGAADYYPSWDLYFPLYGYLDEKFEYYTLNEHLNRRTERPKTVDGHWVLNPFPICHRSLMLDPFDPIRYSQFLTLAPGKAEAIRQASVYTLAPQVNVGGKPGGHGRGDRKINITTGGYFFEGNVRTYSPVTYSYNPADGKLKISFSTTISHSDSKFEYVPTQGRQFDAVWADYCRKDMKTNPDVLGFKDAMTNLKQRDFFLYGDHELEAIYAPEDTSWIALRVVHPDRPSEYDDYILWHDGRTYAFDYNFRRGIKDSFNNFVLQFFDKLGGRPGTLNPSCVKMSNVSEQAWRIPYMVSAAINVLRANPDISDDDPALTKAMCSAFDWSQISDPLKEAKPFKDFFTKYDDGVKARLAQLPEIVDVSTEGGWGFFERRVTLTLRKDKMQWDVPVTFNYTDVMSEQPIRVDLRFDPEVLLNLPGPKPEDVIAEYLPEAIIEMLDKFRTMTRFLNITSQISQQFVSNDDLLRMRAEDPLSHLNTDYLRKLYAHRFGSNSAIEPFYTVGDAIKTCDKLIKERTKQLKAVGKAWEKYRKGVVLPQLQVQDDGHTLTVVNFDAAVPVYKSVYGAQVKLLQWIEQVEKQGTASQYKNFTDDQLRQIISAQ